MLDIASFYLQFWPGLAATIVGGLLLATLLLILKNVIFPIPLLSATWECKNTVNKTKHHPYQGMTVFYRVVLIQTGNQLVGSGEKDNEIAANGHRHYRGEHRNFLEVTGTIEKKIFSPDVVVLKWSEEGEIRKSTSIFKLKVSGLKGSENLFGDFNTTAGPCSGVSEWQRPS